jgi:hypothetical protein
VNKGSGNPGLIIGDFVDYLLQRHRRRDRIDYGTPDLGTSTEARGDSHCAPTKTQAADFCAVFGAGTIVAPAP